jgi:putative transposase
MAIRAYKFRFYPTADQRRQLAIDFGCARFVWNRCLARRSQAWKERHESLSSAALSRDLTTWKQEPETTWLKDASSTVLVQTLADQERAFQNFFARRARYPKFKRREHAQSIRYQLDQRQITRTFRAGEWLKLPKLGGLAIRWSRRPAGTPKMATVSKDACGRYFVAFGCEEDIASLPASGAMLGVDVGLKDVAVTSTGWKSGNPRHLAAKLKRLKRYQRRVSRKEEARKKHASATSNRQHRARARLARMHARVADARRDWLHKLSTHLVRNAQVIALENLFIKGMMANRKLARSLGDAGLSELRRQIEYKAQWVGRTVLYTDRWAPTSKTCSECGSIQKEMPLSLRAWECPVCGASHDRDVNAARNVLIYATGGQPGGWAQAAAHARGGVMTPQVTGAIGHAADPDETRTERGHDESRRDREAA